MKAIVTAVSCNATHSFSKPSRESIRLLAGLGVEGDAHLGQTVKHRSRVAKDPNQPNPYGQPAGQTPGQPAGHRSI